MRERFKGGINLKQKVAFCEGNIIHIDYSFGIKERLKILFRGNVHTSIDQNTMSSTGSISCEYMPHIYKVNRKKK